MKPNPWKKQHQPQLLGSIVLWLVIALLLLLTMRLLVGCTLTVTPEAVHPAQASFDGNIQNSGIITYIEDTRNADGLITAVGGFLITPHFRDRYNELVGRYGTTTVPRLVRDEGVRPAPDGVNFLMDAEHMAKFVGMNMRLKAGLKP